VACDPALIRIGRVLVGLDGSDDARRALEWAISLSLAWGAEVIAVHAVGLLNHRSDGSIVPSHPHLDEIRRRFEAEWCAPLDSAGLKCRKICCEGPSSEVLLDVAEKEQADLVVVGSRGIGGFANLLLGSTSLQVVEHASRPTLVIPSGHAQ
jgi:nucleotide-binding universal stress UspA family protein